MGIISGVSTEDGFFEGFGNFIDGIGGFVENIDFNFVFHDTSNSYRRFINTYLWIRLVDGLFTPRYTICPIGYNCITTDDGFRLPPPTLSAIIALSCIVFDNRIYYARYC